MVAEEDPVAAEAEAAVASARLLAADPVQWAAGWTARTVRPVLRVVGAVVAAGWEGQDQDQDREDGAVVAAAEEVEDLDHRREEGEDPAAVLVQGLVDPAPAPTAAETITACTAATVDTAALVGTAVRLRLITFGTVAVVMATQEIMLGIMAISAGVEEVEGLKWAEILPLINRSPLIAVAVEEEDQAEALGRPGLALHPDRITHSRSSRNTSNRIDMGMVGMDLETTAEVVAVASDLLPPNIPTRIRALHRHSGKIIRARIRHNTIDRQDLVVVVAEQVAVSAAAVVWVQVELYILRQREEPLIMNQEWEEEAGAVLEPLGRITMTPSISDRDQDLHRHHRLDRCNTSNTNKVHRWHLRGQGQTNLLGSLQHRHRHRLLAKRRARLRPSKRQSHRRRNNRRNPRYQRGHPLRHQLIRRPNLWHRPGWSHCERRWSFAMLHFSSSIESWRSFVPNEQFWRSFLSVWMLSARNTTVCMAK